MRPDIVSRLDSLKKDLDRLGTRIHGDGQRALDEFAAKMAASGNRDSTLTEQARNVTDSIKGYVYF